MKSTIRNRKNMSIPVDFQLSNGKIGGTDIDFVLEFDNQFLIMVEIKKEGTDITVGQRLLMERIIDAWRESGKKGIAILATWKGLTDDGFIQMSKCKAEKLYNTDKEWAAVPPMQSRMIELLNIIGSHWHCHKCRF